MDVNEENLSNKENYDELCTAISEAINNDAWSMDFILLDDRNDMAIVDSEDLIKLLEFYKKNEYISTIALKLKRFKGSKSIEATTIGDIEFAKRILSLFGTKMSDSNVFALNINHCEKELEFLAENISKRRKAAKRIIEAKQDLPEMAENVSAAMLRRFDNLLQLLDSEGYYKGTFAWTEIDSCKKAAARNDWETAQKSIELALNYVRPIDIEKMVQLYDMTSKRANELENENICLVLGNSGTYVIVFCVFVYSFCLLCMWTRNNINNNSLFLI